MASPKYTATRRVVYMDPDTRKMVGIREGESFDPPDSKVEELTKSGAIVPYVAPDAAEAQRIAKADARTKRADEQAVKAKQAELQAANANESLATDSDAVRSVPGVRAGSPTTRHGTVSGDGSTTHRS
jgi:hypothetical protein